MLQTHRGGGRNRRAGRWRRAAVRGVGLWLAAVAASRGADLSEDILIGSHPTYAQSAVLKLLGLDQAPRVFVISTRPGGDVTGGGLAVDKVGNVYLSDYGATTNAGSIIMIPADGRKPLRIMQDLDRPSDIEISPDGHALVVAEPDGRVEKRDFGVSVRVAFVSAPAIDPVARLQTDQGTLTARRSGDGYFHFPGVAGPQQVTIRALLTIDNGPITQPFSLELQLANGAIHGQTVVDVVF